MIPTQLVEIQAMAGPAGTLRLDKCQSKIRFDPAAGEKIEPFMYAN